MRLKLLFILLFATTCAMSQVINFPDISFKNKLLSATAVQIGNWVARDVYGNNMIIDSNHNGEIEFAEALEVYGLNVDDANIISLVGIEYFLNLQTLYCVSNQLAILDLRANLNLQYLNCRGNQITDLIVTNLHNLHTIDALLNPLEYFDSRGLTGLRVCSISNSMLKHLDLSYSSVLQYFVARDNAVLRSIDIKDGGLILYPLECNVSNNPSLNRICVDNYEGQIMEQALRLYNVPIYIISSNCDRSDFLTNSIKGHVLFDSTGDGCDENDSLSNFFPLNIDRNTYQNTFFLDNTGEYQVNVGNAGYCEITPSVDPELFICSPESALIEFDTIDGSRMIQDFCIIANGVRPDLEVIISPVSPAIPGLNVQYRVVYTNKGNQPISGMLNFSFNDEVLNYLEASVTPLSISGGHLEWNFENLQPFQHGVVLVSLSLNGVTDVPVVSIGDLLQLTASAVVQNDVTPLDNVFTFTDVVRDASNIIDIICLEGNILPAEKIGDYLYFTIRFANTTATVFDDIEVTTGVYSHFYNPQSIRILDYSHEMSLTFNGLYARFVFSDINLAPGESGYITYKIKTNDLLNPGDDVWQEVLLYDGNRSIDNMIVVAFDLLEKEDFTNIEVFIYPNPTTGLLKIQSKLTVNKTELYDVQGRLLQTNVVNATDGVVDISSKPKGIYLLKVISDRGTVTKKVIKN